jgi:hypothetical protein
LFPLAESTFDPKGKSVEILTNNQESGVKTISEKVSEIKNDVFGSINQTNFYNHIETANIRHNIQYIENHLPKNELSDTTYLETLMLQVKKHVHESVDFLKENYDNLEAKEIGLRNGVIHELTE